MKSIKRAKRIALLIVVITVAIAVALSGCTSKNYTPCSSYASHPAYHNFR
ncbi:MAG TPA: hypothetical protein VFE50_05695 [Cyclobacteriaceae bacterium]|nr:hypothetical protein [Cyclobacteriaceae bacterium]